WAGAFAHHGTDQATRDHQYLIAPAIAVAIVKGLEVIDVKIGQGKGPAGLDSTRRFVEDGRVAGKTGQRIRVQRAGHPAQAQAQPTHDLIGRVGNRDVVIDGKSFPVYV